MASRFGLAEGCPGGSRSFGACSRCLTESRCGKPFKQAPSGLLPEASKGPRDLPESTQTPGRAPRAVPVWAQPLPLQLHQRHTDEEQPRGHYRRQAYYAWEAAQRALCKPPPPLLINSSVDGLFLFHRFRDGTSERSSPQSHGQGLEPPRQAVPPSPPARPARVLPRNSAHLLGIVAIQVHLDSRVWNLLIDGYAFHGDPWTRSETGNRLIALATHWRLHHVGSEWRPPGQHEPERGWA